MIELLSVADAARITGLSEYTIYAACRDGELQASKVRRRVRIHPDALAAWIDECRMTPKGAAARVPTPRPRPTLPGGSVRQALRDRSAA